jgi:hypothetical protein
MKNANEILGGEHGGKRSVGDVSIDKRIILKLQFEKFLLGSPVNSSRSGRVSVAGFYQHSNGT